MVCKLHKGTVRVMKNLFSLVTPFALSIECSLNGTCHQKPEGPSVIHPTLSTRIRYPYIIGCWISSHASSVQTLGEHKAMSGESPLYLQVQTGSSNHEVTFKEGGAQ